MSWHLRNCSSLFPSLLCSQVIQAVHQLLLETHQVLVEIFGPTHLSRMVQTVSTMMVMVMSTMPSAGILSQVRASAGLARTVPVKTTIREISMVMAHTVLVLLRQ